MIERTIAPIERTLIEGLWTSALVNRVRAEVDVALAGQRLRVQDLPRGILERFVQKASEEIHGGVESYFVDLTAGPEPWRVGAHRVVQRRDAADARVVVAAIPPDIKL